MIFNYNSGFSFHPTGGVIGRLTRRLKATGPAG
jgi:hypothetical protein